MSTVKKSQTTAACECKNWDQGDIRSLRRRVDATGLEDLPHGRGGDVVSETGEFAVDAAVAPGWVLGGEAEDELSDLGGGRWASRSS